MITRLLALLTLAGVTLAPMRAAWAECLWVLWAKRSFTAAVLVPLPPLPPDVFNV